ncbi:MAG TPA: hypothetical protein VFF61_08675, partial [Microvirga sp.]|nr:hypothetical protein [Microvirga sp.]
MALTDCPHCTAAIEPTSARLCPACGKKVDDANEIRQSSAREAARAYVLAAIAAGRTSNIARNLGDRHDPALLCDVIKEVAQHNRSRRFEIARSYLWPGYGAIVLGLIITAVTYLSGGPVTVVAYGAIAYGMISVST